MSDIKFRAGQDDLTYTDQYRGTIFDLETGRLLWNAHKFNKDILNFPVDAVGTSVDQGYLLAPFHDKIVFICWLYTDAPGNPPKKGYFQIVDLEDNTILVDWTRFGGENFTIPAVSASDFIRCGRRIDDENIVFTGPYFRNGNQAAHVYVNIDGTQTITRHLVWPSNFNIDANNFTAVLYEDRLIQESGGSLALLQSSPANLNQYESWVVTSLGGTPPSAPSFYKLTGGSSSLAPFTYDGTYAYIAIGLGLGPQVTIPPYLAGFAQGFYSVIAKFQPTLTSPQNSVSFLGELLAVTQPTLGGPNTTRSSIPPINQGVENAFFYLVRGNTDYVYGYFVDANVQKIYCFNKDLEQVWVDDVSNDGHIFWLQCDDDILLYVSTSKCVVYDPSTGDVIWEKVTTQMTNFRYDNFQVGNTPLGLYGNVRAEFCGDYLALSYTSQLSVFDRFTGEHIWSNIKYGYERSQGNPGTLFHAMSGNDTILITSTLSVRNYGRGENVSWFETTDREPDYRVGGKGTVTTDGFYSGGVLYKYPQDNNYVKQMHVGLRLHTKGEEGPEHLVGVFPLSISSGAPGGGIKSGDSVLSAKLVLMFDLDWTEATLQEAKDSFDGDADEFNTDLAPEDVDAFNAWKAIYAPEDSGWDYDLVGLFYDPANWPNPIGSHATDKYKKPNHPTFSTDSQYAEESYGYKDYAGTWDGDVFSPPEHRLPFHEPVSVIKQVSSWPGSTQAAYESANWFGSEEILLKGQTRHHVIDFTDLVAQMSQATGQLTSVSARLVYNDDPSRDTIAFYPVARGTTAPPKDPIRSMRMDFEAKLN